jgi:ATP-dependent RNA helicase DeaD
MQKKLFPELGLSPELLKAIDKVGYEEASPIQSEAIPALLAGRDVVGQSQTGSGKTAAFALPAIELVDPHLRAPQVIILCPTRELAVQVAEEVAKLAAFKKGVRELPIYGGQSYERQFRGLQAGAQIVIGTPGRVMDHLQRGSLKLDQLKMVILDEADRMLDMGFIDDIKTVLEHVPEQRQTVLFSATLPPAIRELIKTFTHDPVNIRIEAKAATTPAIDQVYYEIDRRSKLEVLCRLIDLQDIKYGIIFCATKMMVDELAEHLSARGYLADKIHGDIAQASRERVIAKFRKRSFEFLVATDVAARGLDVDDIEVVFNYDLPHDAEDYIHRIGRTGRAGRAGRAITFVAGREIWKLQNIIRFTKGRIRRERPPSAEEVEEKRASAFYDSLKETLEKGDYKRHDDLIDQLLDQGYAATDIASALIHLLSGDKTRPASEKQKTAPGLPAKAASPYAEKYQSLFGDQIEPKSYRSRPSKEPREPRLTESASEAAPESFESLQERPARPVAQPSPKAPKFAKRETAEPAKRRRENAQRGGRNDWNDREEPWSAESHEKGMVRLVLGIGRDHQVAPGDVLGFILGSTDIPKEDVGAIRVQTKRTFVDVDERSVRRVVKKVNGLRFKGRKLSVEPAS